MNRRKFLRQSLVSVAGTSLGSQVDAPRAGASDRPWEWSHYGGDPEATRYSPLDQINRSNVKQLKRAWVHHTGDMLKRPVTTIECTPIVVDGVMYITTPRLKVQALDASSGKLLWTFDPFRGSQSRRPRGVNRGVTYWRGDSGERIFVVAQANLIALNAKTGALVEGFGNGGSVDLRDDFDADVSRLYLGSTTPGPIYEDLLIVGAGGGEGPQPAAPGHIRAYDVHTGKRRWIFHTVPFEGEFGNDTWARDSWKTAGGCNCWAGMSVDRRRGLVFAGLGSPTFDFYGGNRIGTNLFGNCVVALDAASGERRWHFQTVHHDLWDYDIPCQPILGTVLHNGQQLDAVAQPSKTGWVYLLDRENGEPLFPVEERPVPVSDVAGEQAWPTQPFPTKPPAFCRQSFGEADLTDLSPGARAAAARTFREIRSGPIFTPPSKRGTLIMPGFHGGALWGGGAFDPESGRLFVTSNEIPWIMTLTDAPSDAGYRYEHLGYHRFQDAQGYPAVKPPWGRLTAIDLNQGELVWQVALGEHKELLARGVPPTGTENLGGVIATKGGLLFVGATKDEKFRAYDADTGEVLWQTSLPAGGYATPCTYEAGGKQYVVIAAGGGGKSRTRPGDAFVAFSLG